MNARRFHAAAAAVVVLAAVLRFWALDVGLPHQLARPDEQPVVHEMARPARGDFALQMVIYPNAYVYATWLWVEAGLRLGPALGMEPTGGFQRTLLRTPERIFWLGRTLSATAGTATVLLVIVFTRRSLGSSTALVAGLLTATCFLHARDSHALKPDALLSLTMLVALGAAVSLAKTGGRSGGEPGGLARGVRAGAAVGLAMATKYTALLMLVPLYVAAVLGATTKGARRLVPAAAVWGGLTAAAVFIATSPYLIFSGKLAGFLDVAGAILLPDANPAADNAALPDAYAIPASLDRAPYGATPWWHGLVYHARFSLWYGIGALGTLLAPVAVVSGLLSRRPLTTLAATAVLVNYVVLGLTPAVTARYVTHILPLLAILEADWLARAARRLAPTRANLVLAVAAGAVALQPFLASVAHERIASQKDTRVLAAEWLEEHLESGARLQFAGSVLMPYGQPTPPPDTTVLQEPLEADALRAAKVDYLITHEHALYFSSPDPEAIAALQPHLTLEAEFDPSSPAGGEAVFEDNDAYYIPIHGFGAVIRPGPHIRIYRIRVP